MSYRTLLKSLVPAALIAMPASAFAAPETYKLDADHTAIQFQVDHFGFSTPTGKFMNVDGTLVLDEDNPENSSVEVTIPVTKVVTGVPALDEHLLTDDFFGTAEFPEAKFVSTSVQQISDTEAYVFGDLTIRDVTRPVGMTVELNKIGTNMMGAKTAGFSAYTIIKRSEFGIDTYVPDLGDEVTLYIESEANLVADLEAAE